MKIITRFAPSPTGNLHIGGARTAIFNYLFARRHNGKFILRIEDTDTERSKKEYEEEILKSMKWLGMDYDDDPIYQSQRSEIYKTYIKKLIDSGNAYYCNCSREELDEQRQLAMKEKKPVMYNRKCRDLNLSEGVVRFKTPLDGITTINDAVLGDIDINNKELDDFIIARTDGSATYNFTVVVDDHEMGISHVIRGDDHVNNTPKQMLIYKALNIDIPVFAHVPMILGPDKKKLSKRHGATAVSQYREDGYLNEALFNYLVRLSWSHGDDEIFTKEELIKIFSLDNINKSSAVLNVDKLNWLNAHYIKTMDPNDMVERLIAEDISDEDERSRLEQKDIISLLPLVQQRAKKLYDVYEGLQFLLNEDIVINEDTRKKYLKEELKPIVQELLSNLEALDDLANEKAVESIFKQLIEKHSIKMKPLAQAVRVLLTGTDVSPGIFEVLAVMSREMVFKRLAGF